MRKRIAMVIFSLAIFAVSCKSPTTANHEEPGLITLNITGTVTDAKTGSPIAGALLELRDFQWEGGPFTIASSGTDKEGRYSLRKILVNDEHTSWALLRLRASAKGYWGTDVRNDYHVQRTEQAQVANFQLWPF